MGLPFTGKRVGYKRVSTDEQSTESQLVGVELDKLFLDVETGYSTKNRFGLKLLKDYVREDDIVYVECMDRLGRNGYDLDSTVNFLLSQGVEIHFVREGIHLGKKNDMMSKFAYDIIKACIHFMSQLAKERQRIGIEKAKRAGKYKGRERKLGYSQIETLKQDITTTRKSKNQISKELGVSRQTLRRYFKGAGIIMVIPYRFMQKDKEQPDLFEDVLPKKRRNYAHLDFEERKKIKEFLVKGYTHQRIAQLMDRSLSCIWNEVYKNGGPMNYDPKKAQDNRWSKLKTMELSNEERREHIRRNNSLNLEERKRMKELFDKGYTYEKIARIMGRAKSTFVNEFRRAGGREGYDPERAHKLFLLGWKEPVEKIVEENEQEIEDIEEMSSPPRGERSDFLKVTITLPAETLLKLKELGLKRKANGEIDTDVSCLVREALKLLLEEEGASLKDAPIPNNLEERIENLEMQLDIILNTIKDIKR